MGKRKSPDKAAGREKKWDKVFNALVTLSQNLQKDRQFLEERIKSLHQVIYKMKMEQKVESAKAELILGLKDREAFIYKHRYGSNHYGHRMHLEPSRIAVRSGILDSSLFLDCRKVQTSKQSGLWSPKVTGGIYLKLLHVHILFAINCLSVMSLTLIVHTAYSKDKLDDLSNEGDGSRNKALQNEVRKLKSEIEKCKSEKNSEISALLREKKFVWNQLKMMESDYTTQLRKKSDEVEHANERLQALVNRAEELQISNEKLRIDFDKMESESVKKSEEILRLLKEIELLKSKLGSASPLLRPCRTEPAASDRNGKNTSTGGRGETLKKESDSSQTSDKEDRIRSRQGSSEVADLGRSSEVPEGSLASEDSALWKLGENRKMAHRKRSAHKSTGGKAPRKQFISKVGVGEYEIGFLETKGEGSSSSKRKAAEVITIPDTPKLFTSNFKVPKLKSSSTPRRV
ncbi:UNVERIFIED_CONTAM: hypothetical protein Sradi_3739500 [Sesamum radiatum]|uniref:Uncharacterized protein n=1 Tax=Sesamum radiatum TaxID=300843 RepID=A0AAW2PYE4_SESRA